MLFSSVHFGLIPLTHPLLAEGFEFHSDRISNCRASKTRGTHIQVVSILDQRWVVIALSGWSRKELQQTPREIRCSHKWLISIYLESISSAKVPQNRHLSFHNHRWSGSLHISGLVVDHVVQQGASVLQVNVTSSFTANESELRYNLIMLELSLN